MWFFSPNIIEKGYICKKNPTKLQYWSTKVCSKMTQTPSPPTSFQAGRWKKMQRMLCSIPSFSSHLPAWNEVGGRGAQEDLHIQSWPDSPDLEHMPAQLPSETEYKVQLPPPAHSVQDLGGYQVKHTAASLGSPTCACLHHHGCCGIMQWGLGGKHYGTPKAVAPGAPSPSSSS